MHTIVLVLITNHGIYQTLQENSQRENWKKKGELKGKYYMNKNSIK